LSLSVYLLRTQIPLLSGLGLSARWARGQTLLPGMGLAGLVSRKRPVHAIFACCAALSGAGNQRWGSCASALGPARLGTAIASRAQVQTASPRRDARPEMGTGGGP